MNSRLLSKAIQITKSSAMLALASLVFSGCGGGGGGSADTQIAPASLEQVDLTLFDAFNLKFFRLDGTDGNEDGAVNYTNYRSPFRIFSSQGSNLVKDISLPATDAIRGFRYNYQRTSTKNAILTLTWDSTIQAYPFGTATKTTPNIGGNEMFWGKTRSGTMSLGIVFTESNGVISTATSVRNIAYTSYTSLHIGPGDADSKETYTPIIDEFTSYDANFALNGARVPLGYKATPLAAGESASIVHKSISDTRIRFISDTINTNTRDINFEATPNAPVVIIPTLSSGVIQESGDIIIASTYPTAVTNGSGEYSYARPGGVKSKLSIRFQDGIFHYDLTYTANDRGTYSESTSGDKGIFIFNTYTN